MSDFRDWDDEQWADALDHYNNGPHVWQHKPIQKTVYRYDGTNGQDIARWVADPSRCWVNESGELVVVNQQADFVASPTDWVVLGLEGHIYPVPEGVFLASYEDPEAGQ